MNSATTSIPMTAMPSRRRFPVGAGCVVLALVMGLPLLCAIEITGYFRLSSATRALRSSVMESVPGQWDKRIAVHLGSLTLDLVRFGSRFFKLPPEPRAAIDSLHGAEVGVYRLHDAPATVNYYTILAAADKSMSRRGWERIVGVAEGRQFVAVYAPHGIRTVGRLACCVLVLHEQDLVVASVRGNPEPLLELVRRLPANNFALVSGFPKI